MKFLSAHVRLQVLELTSNLFDFRLDPLPNFDGYIFCVGGRSQFGAGIGLSCATRIATYQVSQGHQGQDDSNHIIKLVFDDETPRGALQSIRLHIYDEDRRSI